MITDTQAEKANDFIRDNAAIYARAKAERIYLEQFRKSQKAIMFQDAPAGTVAEKEAFAYSHPDYISVITALRHAVVEEETLRWQMVAAEAKIDVWRTQQANNRKGV